MDNLNIARAIWNGKWHVTSAAARRTNLAVCALVEDAHRVVHDISFRGLAIIIPVLMVADIDGTCHHVLFSASLHQ
jgi:hypothetical protein